MSATNERRIAAITEVLDRRLGLATDPDDVRYDRETAEAILAALDALDGAS